MQQIIKRILKDVDYKNNPYFVALNNGSFTKEDFIATQMQFYYAVVFFNRPMTALVAKIPDSSLRLEIIRNIWEEHGEGNLDRMHANTFLEFLSRLGGITKQQVEKQFLWPEVRIFNTTLIGACVLDDFLNGVSVMGVIEMMFSDISHILGQGLIKRGWMSESNMIHYTLHKDLDVKHSQDFFDVLEKFWNDNTKNQYYIEQGLTLGATLFNNFYRDLFLSRKRRQEKNQRIVYNSRVDELIV